MFTYNVIAVTKLSITFQQLRSFLLQKNLQELFNENHRKGQISKSNRIKLVNALACLVHEQYSGNASQKEIINICEGTIGLFPCLKGVNNSIGYIVSFNESLLWTILFFSLF